MHDFSFLIILILRTFWQNHKLIGQESCHKISGDGHASYILIMKVLSERENVNWKVMLSSVCVNS